MASNEKPMILKVQDFLNKKFNYRYNEVLGRTEFQFQEGQSNYKMLTDFLQYGFDKVNGCCLNPNIPN